MKGAFCMLFKAARLAGWPWFITNMLRSVTAPRATVLGTLLLGAATANLYAANFSDDNWTAMAGYAGVNDLVNATVVDGDGNLYIGGWFTVVGDLPANCIAKWNGTNWSALGSGLQENNGSAVVSALAVSGNELYAAGRFTTAGGVAANSIAKWNGTNWSALGSGITGDPRYVLALAVSGSDLYVAGYFTTAGGVAANHIAKWNGSSWSLLGSGISGAPHDLQAPRVLALAVSDSGLYVGGWFTNAGGITANGLAKWDGSSWSALGLGVNRGVSTLAVSGSDLYAFGYFPTEDGTTITNVGKWNGRSWSALDSAVGSGIGYPMALTVSGGELYAGGRLNTPFGSGGAYTSRAYVAKWTGSAWLELGPGITGNWGDGGDPQVYALAVSGTNVYAGGAFQQAGEVRAYCIAKWNGINWSALDSKFRYVGALTASGRDVYGAGGFAAADGTQSNYVVKWNGSDWSPISTISTGMFSDVSALAVAGNDFYAGGTFTNVAGISANRIARWDGTNWSALGTGINGDSVDALAVSGSDLFAAGDFKTAGGITANNIAKWNGSTWSALGSGMNARVFALVVSGSELYAGGWFSTAGGNAANSIAKWDGTNWFPLGAGITGNVYALAAAGTNLYVGGYFFEAGGLPIRHLAKWDGSNWSQVGSGLLRHNYDGPHVYALFASGTDLYVGGWFATDGGDLNIAKWNGTGWSGLGSGVNGGVGGLAVADTDLLVAGSFTTAGGKISPNLARARIGSIVKSLAAANSIASIQFSGVTGYQYDVQRATNLNSPITWTTLTTSPLSPAPDGAFTFTDTNAPPGAAFYRAQELP
jgi:hypothetical protein